MKKNGTTDTKSMVMCAILTALVIILQLLGSFIKFGPFSISLVLIPIVIGASVCGVSVAAWLGFVFGAVVLISGDAAAFMAVSPVGTILTVLSKGVLCGAAAGATFKALSRLNGTMAVAASAIVCPIVNTGVFILGCFAFFMEIITEWAAALGFGGDVTSYMIFGLVGVNFLVEVAFNIVLSPAVVRVLNIKARG